MSPINRVVQNQILKTLKESLIIHKELIIRNWLLGIKTKT